MDIFEEQYSASHAYIALTLLFVDFWKFLLRRKPRRAPLSRQASVISRAGAWETDRAGALFNFPMCELENSVGPVIANDQWTSCFFSLSPVVCPENGFIYEDLFAGVIAKAE